MLNSHPRSNSPVRILKSPSDGCDFRRCSSSFATQTFLLKSWSWDSILGLQFPLGSRQDSCLRAGKRARVPASAACLRMLPQIKEPLDFAVFDIRLIGHKRGTKWLLAFSSAAGHCRTRRRSRHSRVFLLANLDFSLLSLHHFDIHFPKEKKKNLCFCLFFGVFLIAAAAALTGS